MNHGGEIYKRLSLSTKKVKFGGRKSRLYSNGYMLGAVVLSQIVNVYAIFASSDFPYVSLVSFLILCYSGFFYIKLLKEYVREKKSMEKTGIEFCNACDGYGYLFVLETRQYVESKKIEKKKDLIHCPKCRGRGKIDWIEKVTRN